MNKNHQTQGDHVTKVKNHWNCKTKLNQSLIQPIQTEESVIYMFSIPDAPLEWHPLFLLFLL